MNLNAQFTGTAGTALSAYTDDSGGSWYKYMNSAGSASLNGSGGVSASSIGAGETVTYASTLTPATDNVTHTFQIKTQASNFGYAFCLSGSNRYQIFSNGSQITVQKISNGSGSTLATGSAGLPATPYTMTVTETRNASTGAVTIVATVGGTTYINATDNAGLPPGDVGIFWFGPGNAGVMGPITTTETGAASILAPYNDASIFWQGFLVDGTNARTTNCGSYFKTQITGTYGRITLLAPKLSTTTNQNFVFRWSVDNGPWQTSQMFQGQNAIPLFSALSNAAHRVEWYVDAKKYDLNAWDPALSVFMQVAVTGFRTSASGSFSAHPNIRPKRMLAVGDSITEHLNIQGTDLSAAAQRASGGWVSFVASALNAEYVQDGHGSIGYATAGADGTPAVPTSYNLMWSGQARDLTTFDTIIIFLGTNGTTTSAQVQDLLTKYRAANPTATIYQVVPTYSTPSAAAIASGFAAASLSNAYLVTMTQLEGLNVNAVTRFYNDGIHPTTEGNGRIGAQMIDKMLRASTIIPAANNVKGGTGTYGFLDSRVTPTLTILIPSADQMLTGTTASDGTTSVSGNVTLPAANKVVTSTTYGPSTAPLTGNVSLPTVDKVLAPTQYGANGNQFTGTATQSGGGGQIIFGSVATVLDPVTGQFLNVGSLDINTGQYRTPGS